MFRECAVIQYNFKSGFYLEEKMVNGKNARAEESAN